MTIPVLKGDYLSSLGKYSTFSLSWSRKRSLGKKRWKKNPFSNLLAHSRPNPGKHINRRPAPSVLCLLCAVSLQYTETSFPPADSWEMMWCISPLLAPLLDLARGCLNADARDLSGFSPIAVFTSLSFSESTNLWCLACPSYQWPTASSLGQK